MAFKFLKENGYPVDLILISKEIEATDENLWNELQINIFVNNDFIESIYCKRTDYSNTIKHYRKGFFTGTKQEVNK